MPTKIPSPLPPSSWKRWCVLPTVLLVAWLLSLTPVHNRLLNSLHDSELRLVAQERHFDSSLVVDIDETSLRQLAPYVGAWPFKHDFYALVIDYLREAGAKVIALDIVFADARGDESALKRSLSKMGPVVLAVGGLREPPYTATVDQTFLQDLAWHASTPVTATEWAAYLPPTAALFSQPAGSTPRVGMISVRADADGIVRGLPLLHRSGNVLLPSLPLAAVTAMDPVVSLEQVGRQLQVGAHQWPLDARGYVLLNYPANHDALRVMPFHVLALAALGVADQISLSEQFKGRAVFIGGSAMLGDSVLTPLGPRSGTVMHALGYESLSRGLVIRPARWFIDAWLVLIACVPMLWAAARARTSLSGHMFAALISTSALLLLDLGLLAGAGQQVNMVSPITVVALGLLAGVWQHQQALRVANRELAHRREIADAASRAKSEFVANMSHEFRTPLNAVLGMAELLAATPLTPEQRRYVDIFQNAGHDLLALINDLLDLSKIEAGQLELIRAPFSLGAMLAEQRSLLAPRALNKGLSFAVLVQPDVDDLVFGDRQRLRQIVVNLVGNAIKFTASGYVRLTVAREAAEPDLIRFAVEDSGIGIAPEKLGAIFKPFVQADSNIGKAFGGTGLGLSISQRLAHMMGGGISVQSQPNQGSVFCFTAALPKAEALTSADSTDTGDVAAPPIGDSPLPALAILLVEDHPHNVMLIEALLRDGGHHIDVAHSGQAGVEKFALKRYDLVLMDVQMPGMDGYAATRELRRLEQTEYWPRTPVIALTANAFASDARLSTQAGCDAHLTKPISKAVLLQALRQFGPQVSCVIAADETPAPQQVESAVADAAASVDGPLARLEHSGLFDVQTILERLNGDRDLLLRVVVAWRPQLSAWEAHYAQALSSGDLALANRMVHDLKGAAATLGASVLVERVIALEAALRKNHTSSCADLQAEVKAALLAHVAAIDHALTAPRITQDRTE